MTKPLSIWTNACFWTSDSFSDPDIQLLRDGTADYKLILARELEPEEANDALCEADIAFGQPDAQTIINSAQLRWAHITSAGYTAYDRDDLKAALRARGAALTNSSQVFNEPCAQHVLAMMLADARQLLPAYEAQRTNRDWNTARHRMHSYLLQDQTVLFLGFGAIGRRLAQLLAPFNVKVVAVRRHPRGDEEIEVVGEDQLDAWLPKADHVVNILPDNPATHGYVSAQRLSLMKQGARFYNIGRGTTVDQTALLQALENDALVLAYLDVTDPEPLPSENPLWTTPNCYITPHTAGGHAGEGVRLIHHFLRNLRAWEKGEELQDRVI